MFRKQVSLSFQVACANSERLQLYTSMHNNRLEKSILFSSKCHTPDLFPVLWQKCLQIKKDVLKRKKVRQIEKKKKAFPFKNKFNLKYHCKQMDIIVRTPDYKCAAIAENCLCEDIMTLMRPPLHYQCAIC